MDDSFATTTTTTAAAAAPLVGQASSLAISTSAPFSSYRFPTEFDELYDISEGEEEADIPITLEIPSPTNWPLPASAKLAAAQNLATPATATAAVTATANDARLARLDARTPSLDGSLTSDELNTMSCPSTPNLGREPPSDADKDASSSTLTFSDEWAMPQSSAPKFTLDPESLLTLARLTQEPTLRRNNQHYKTGIISSSVDAVTVRTSPVPNTPTTPTATATPILDIATTTPVNPKSTPILPSISPSPSLSVSLHSIRTSPSLYQAQNASFAEAVTIPSPRGFFETLNPTARSAWDPHVRPTATATSTAPLITTRSKPSNIDLRLDGSDNGFLADGPPTARKINTSTSSAAQPDHSYDSRYTRKLAKQSSANLDRTSNWLATQDFGSNFADTFASHAQEWNFDLESAATTPHQFPAPPQEPLPILRCPPLPVALPPSGEHHPESAQDSVLLQAFKHLDSSASQPDTFLHRKTRSEKLRLDRKCLSPQHLQQLSAQFSPATAPKSPSSLQPDSLPLPNINTNMITKEDETERYHLALAKHEQSALTQVEPAKWAVDATKFLNGGTLLISPVTRILNANRKARVLDLGGLTHADWAWQVAIDYPSATVLTASSTPQGKPQSFATPSNHRQCLVSNLWTLPFPDNYFDCISARNLHALLKTTRPKLESGYVDSFSPAFSTTVLSAEDEYDLTIRECLRVLRPGAYFEFSLLDAEIVGAGPLARKFNSRFASSLVSSGYDPAPTRSWLGRVRRAGFTDRIRRAWLVLPMSQHPTIAAARYPSTGGIYLSSPISSSPSGQLRFSTTTFSSRFSSTTLGHNNQSHVSMESGEPSTASVSHITGVAGGWSWERWIAGSGNTDLLQAVPTVLEEGAASGAAWRYLSGWARKPKDN